MRWAVLRSLVVLAIVLAPSLSAFCQTLPTNWGIEWSVRPEYLFGTQGIREAVAPNPWNGWPDRLRVDYHPGLWVISGFSEVSPLPRVYARVSGTTSISSSPHDQARFMFTPLQGPSLGGVWPVSSHFTSWEVAGGYYFAYDGLYRLSLAAGYRQQWWKHAGATGNNQLQDTLTSSIPFLLFGAEMYLPGWSSRFELLGSPFMSKGVSCTAVQGASYSHYLGKFAGCGRVEVRVTGMGSLTQSLLWGVTAKYVFEGLSGPIRGVIDGVGQGPYDGYVEESMGQVGFQLTWIM